MKIHIPTKQEKEQEGNKYMTMQSGLSDGEDFSNVDSGESSYSSNSSNNTNSNNSKLNSNSGKKININTATQTQLETLPGVGTATANKIIIYRKEQGKFQKIEDIKQVSGIGEAKFEKIKDLISVR